MGLQFQPSQPKISCSARPTKAKILSVSSQGLFLTVKTQSKISSVSLICICISLSAGCGPQRRSEPSECPATGGCQTSAPPPARPRPPAAAMPLPATDSWRCRAAPYARSEFGRFNPWRCRGSRPQDCRCRSMTCAWGAPPSVGSGGRGAPILFFFIKERRFLTKPPSVAADGLVSSFSGISGIPEPEISGTRIIGFSFSRAIFGFQFSKPEI